MTRLPHPDWCDPGSCSAYWDPRTAEPLHRSKPARIRKALDEWTVYVALVQDPVIGSATVELVALADPQPPLWWDGGDVCRELSLELAEATELADVLKTLVHLERKSR